MRSQSHKLYHIVTNPNKKEVTLNVAFSATLKIMMKWMWKIFFRDRFSVFQADKHQPKSFQLLRLIEIPL